MRTLKITDTETGQEYSGRMPEGWHEVPLSAFQQYARLQAERRPELELLSAVQALTDLPADTLEADVSLAANLGSMLPWFFALPTGEPASTLTHHGVTYLHCQDFGRLSAGQFEALLAFLDAAGNNPGVAAPELLAVLLVRKGVKQDARAVREATAAFASLSMEQAWPYVANFLTAWSSSAVRLQASSLVKIQTETALLQIVEALSSAPRPAGRLRRLCSGIVAALGKRYVRSVLGQLRSS
ncbi:hypothetical protein [Hymenobacter tenuis]